MDYVILWSGLGLIGTAVLLTKSARKSQAPVGGLLSLPFAVVFGPIFLLIALTARAQKLCPHCKSSIDREATACPECTRDVELDEA